jgi:hypothetical protein
MIIMYNIYELDSSVLVEKESLYDTYKRYCLIELDSGFPSMEDAFASIQDNKSKYQYRDITILPAISIDWED